MVVDTGTVRLVIFFGMFLVFAGDYSSLVTSIFGSSQGMASAAKNTSLRGPEGPPRSSSGSFDNLGSMMDEKEDVENDAMKRARLMATIKNACLPKLICELTSSPYQDQLSEMEKSLLNLISFLPLLLVTGVKDKTVEKYEKMRAYLVHERFRRDFSRVSETNEDYSFPTSLTSGTITDTSLTTIAEVPSRYHFAAHMGQLIAGVEGQGCHNFYPTCPLPRSSVLNMMKKIRLR